mmetsp:Transcript_54616/g.129031  ORF Transcript_54616/g.129031 Transcript_54616/m.129031 type:complete len:271 (-) Transcript_54616:191-1003(-)
MPSCSTVTGNWALGYDVSQSRNCGWARSGEICSQVRSSVGIHEGAKWQFWSTHHVPRSMASSIMRSAMGPCPCPSDSDETFFDMPIDAARVRRAFMGSAPGERMKMRGDVTLESLYAEPRSKGGGSTNLAPICSTTRSCTAGTTRSGRTQRRRSKRWKWDSADSRPPGMGWSWGSACSTHACQSAACATKLSVMRAKLGSWPRATRSAQTLSPTQSIFLAGPLAARPGPPVRRKRSSVVSSCWSCCSTRTVMRKEKRSLSFSKRERHTLR